MHLFYYLKPNRTFARSCGFYYPRFGRNTNLLRKEIQMKLKLDEKGNVVVVDGKPVYTHDDGKE
ncbi:hypothetical protein ACI3P4_13205, partial [Glaesserella parasuis]